MRKLAIAVSLTFLLADAPVSVGADRNGAGSGHGGPRFTPGDPGIGDPYFPLDGNGGYDVDHYDLAIRYDPATRPAARRGDDPGSGHAGPVVVQP